MLGGGSIKNGSCFLLVVQIFMKYLLKHCCRITRSCWHKSRSEQAPGSVFHPRGKSGKIYCNFFQTFGFNIKVDPER